MTYYTDEDLIDVITKTSEGTTHVYWSTHCRHDSGDGKGHRACSATEVVGRGTTKRGVRSKRVTIERPVSIERKPAQCKTCASPCICPCHAREDGR